MIKIKLNLIQLKLQRISSLEFETTKISKATKIHRHNKGSFDQLACSILR